MEENKHWSMYLPYSVKVKYNAGMHFGETEINGLDFDGFKVKGIEMWFRFEYGKLILRPISDLRKDEFFDLYMELCEELEMVSCEYLLEALELTKSYNLSLNKIVILEEWMNKNHFDWKYDLIGRSLAIDINTLKNK